MLHLGSERAHLTIKKFMKASILECVKFCEKCQVRKLPMKIRGKLPVKTNEKPWDHGDTPVLALSGCEKY